ncbi:LysE family transporter [Klebsiella michiganensis]|nr:LysE family transporter [Klebsiella michiganensis]MDM6772110.1 LysE family transporter [Klebsiella michiganensis]
MPRALNQPLSSADSTMPSASQRFRQGVLVSLFNPKPIVFFMALFPQFIHPQQPFIPQFSVLSITFCILVVVIHSLYGLFAHSVKTKMSSGNAFVKLNKTGGIVFVCFAVGLIVSAVHPYLSLSS